MPSTLELYAGIYDRFQTAISRYDCGQKCAPLNGGEPVCCTTGNAIPIVDKAEWSLLQGRTDLWSKYRPKDAHARALVADLHPECTAIKCKGAKHCERDNRTLACRAFPFFPYITGDRRFAGLATMWTFEDRCWVISNLQIVDVEFVREFVDAYDALFAHDADEFEGNFSHSVSLRRVFTRAGRIIPLIGRDGAFYAVEPKTHVIRPASLSEFPRHASFEDEARVRGEPRPRPKKGYAAV